MARLPDLDTLGARPVPVSRRGVASNPRAGAVGQALEGFGGTLAQVGSGLQQKEDRLAYASARAALLKSDIEARQEIENEPDFEKWESSYDERMTRARGEASQLIRSKADRALFEQETQDDLLRGRSAVSTAANGRRRDARVASLDDGLATYLGVAQSATDEPTRAAARNGASELIRGAVERGDITAVDAGNRSRGFVQDDIMGQAETMLLADDFDGAAAFLARNQGLLDQQSRESLARRIDQGLDNRRTLSRAQEAVHGARQPVGAPDSSLAVAGKPGEVADVLSSAGYSDAVVAGFLGNFDVEAGYDGARGDGGSASGIGQWRNERRENFRQMFGKDPHDASPTEQAKFVLWEMQNPEQAGMTVAQRDKILAAQTPEEAAALIDANYERSSGAHRQRRQEAARAFHGGVAQGPQKHDLNDVYAGIDARAEAEGWTPEETEAVKAQAARIVDRDENLLNRQFSEASGEAAQVIASLPNGLTNIAQIPRSVRERMDPVDVAKLEQGIRERNEKASQQAQEAAQQNRATELEFMRRFEPAKFRALDPLQEANRLSPSQYSSFMMNYLTDTKTESFDPTSNRGAITEEINFQERHGGLNFKDEDKVNLYDTMEALLSIIQSKKGRIDRADYADAFRTAMRQDVDTSRFWGENNHYYETLSDVPPDVEAEIIRNWQGRQPPTKGQIIAVYMHRLTGR